MTTQDLHVRITGVIGSLLHGAAAIAQEAMRRRRFSRLRDLDDHILEDIGVTRAEVEIATRLPFTHDAATELRRLAADRRRRETDLPKPLSPVPASALRRQPGAPRPRP